MNPFPRIWTMISNTLMHEGLPEAAYGAYVGHRLGMYSLPIRPRGQQSQYGLKAYSALRHKADPTLKELGSRDLSFYPL
jgi:hypothetical protein